MEVEVRRRNEYVEDQLDPSNSSDFWEQLELMRGGTIWGPMFFESPRASVASASVELAEWLVGKCLERLYNDPQGLVNCLAYCIPRLEDTSADPEGIHGLTFPRQHFLSGEEVEEIMTATAEGIENVNREEWELDLKEMGPLMVSDMDDLD